MNCFNDDFIRGIMNRKKDVTKLHLLKNASDASRDDLFNQLIFAIQNATTTTDKISLYYNDKSLILTSHPELTKKDLTKLVEEE